jgi:hypothetical protein
VYFVPGVTPYRDESCQRVFVRFSAGGADKVNLKYTDSGLIKVILISPKMLDLQQCPFLY